MEGFRRSTQHDSHPSNVEGDFLRDDGLTAPLPKWYREPGEDDGYKPWQHTPLMPYSPDVIGHQNELYGAFYHLAIEPYPADLDETIRDLVVLDYMSGNARRQAQCAANFNYWVENHPDELAVIEQDEELNWLLGEAKHGYGTPASLLKLMMAAPSLKSLDLQVITTPYGYRRQHLPEMEQELIAAVESVGGHYFTVPFGMSTQPNISFHNSDPDNPDDPSKYALIVTDKHLLATCGAPNKDPLYTDEIKIVQREAFVIDINHGRFHNLIRKFDADPDAVNHEVFKEQIRTLIAEKDGIIPTSTMVYAHRVCAHID